MLILICDSDNKKDDGSNIGKYICSYDVTLRNLILTRSLSSRCGSKTKSISPVER
jgi:hypothetical protein